MNENQYLTVNAQEKDTISIRFIKKTRHAISMTHTIVAEQFNMLIRCKLYVATINAVP